MKIRTRARRTFDAEARLREDMQGTFRATSLESAVEKGFQKNNLQVLAKTTDNNTNDDNFEMLSKKIHRATSSCPRYVSAYSATRIFTS